MLQKAWHLPFRKLVLAMPLTALLVALAAHTVTDLGWTESLLLGRAAVADRPGAVVERRHQPARAARRSATRSTSSPVSTTAWRCRRCSRSRPRRSRATTSSGGSSWSRTSGVGAITGIVVAFAAARMMPRGDRLEGGPSAHQKALYALGRGLRRLRQPPCSRPRATASSPCSSRRSRSGSGGRTSASASRPAPRTCSRWSSWACSSCSARCSPSTPCSRTAGRRWRSSPSRCWSPGRSPSSSRSRAAASVDTAGKAFMAWFGPKGVATMTFALFVLGSIAPRRPTGSSAIAALAVFVSIIVHGLTDHPGVEWMARRAEREEAASAA